MKSYTEIKTFEDACKVERLNPKKVIPDFKVYPVNDRKAMIAHAKLVIIARALNRLANNGKTWKPDWNNEQWDKYYPWFWMNGGSSGFRFDDCDYWTSLSDVGSRLCFISREVATHAGNQFLNLYKAYFTL
ncbi:hypothetical protein WSM22_03080 [Cytophagales bacterium WSM2-2]|nr:hypothetical protein WSM22_03080 [Cytophagales bacterium WSM2-2]